MGRRTGISWFSGQRWIGLSEEIVVFLQYIILYVINAIIT